MNKISVTSPMYGGLTKFLRWRDEFMATYGKLAAQQQAQLALYAMRPEMMTYLLLSTPEGLEQLMKLAKGD